MKKCINALGICLLMISIMISTVAFASNEIKVAIDGEYVEFDVKPQLINDRTMVPMRAIFEALGAKVSWDSTSQTAIGETSDTTIKITIGQDYLLKNGNRVAVDSPAVIISGRTLVPVRAIAESLDCSVNWIGETQLVNITSCISENSAETFIGEWELVGFINDFEELGYADESFGKLEFRNDGTVIFSTFDGESSILNYEVDKDKNVIVKDSEYIMIGSISTRSSELHLKEYHAMTSDDDISWITQKNHTIKRKTYMFDDITYIEVDYGHIFKRID